MKFCKRYEEYMRGRREKELPALGLKQLKKILKRCGREFQSQHQKQDGGGSKFAGNCAGIISLLQVHYSKQGQAFRSKAPSMHIEILQSPWLCELMAFCINLRQRKLKNKAITELYNDCSLTFDDDGKPTLSCGLFDSMQIEIDLTCSICLVSLLLYVRICLFCRSCSLL
ncbi:hypothetical protein B296_00015620 [Ensete ventricosum]|uniref:RING-type E3 ubiquitin transferase n=1 Tax=Ensete ventricosum TaxID=4639 RepID=A0A427B6L8_ENSVE|nr:hypothetical protein B296_00015620 [Ensete ventricosum]